MYTTISTYFTENKKEYQYIPGANHVVVRDLSKYGSPVIKYLKEGGIYETLKGNFEARVLVEKLFNKCRKMEDDAKAIVYELRR